MAWNDLNLFCLNLSCLLYIFKKPLPLEAAFELHSARDTSFAACAVFGLAKLPLGSTRISTVTLQLELQVQVQVDSDLARAPGVFALARAYILYWKILT